MDCRKLPNGRYVVRELYISDHKYIWKNLCEFNSEDDGLNYISKSLDSLFRCGPAYFTEINPSWKTNISRPITEDIITDMKKRFNKGYRWNCYGKCEKQWSYLTSEEYDKCVDEYFETIMSRLWEAFKRNNINSRGRIDGQMMQTYKYCERDINRYKNGDLYKQYTKEIRNTIERRINEFAAPYPIIIDKSPHNIKEAVAQSIYNVSHPKKIPTMVGGFSIYLAALAIESIFRGGVAIWIPTTIIFFTWRHEQVKKYHGMCTKEEMYKLDLYNRNY